MEYGFFEEIKSWKNEKLSRAEFSVPHMNLIGRVIMAFMPITPKGLVRFSREGMLLALSCITIKVMEDMANENTSFTVDVL